MKVTVCSKIVENELQGNSPSLLSSPLSLAVLIVCFLVVFVFVCFLLLYMSNGKQC